MRDRIKQVRKSAGMTQAAFGRAVGVSLSAEQKWEIGISVPSDAAVMNICSLFGIRKEWLLFGVEPMKSEAGIAAEMTALVDQLFRDRPDTFKARLISALIRYDADGPQWRVLEEIYESVAAEASAPALDDRAALHAELDRQLGMEKGGKSSA